MLPNKIQEDMTPWITASSASGWISNIYGAVPNLNFNPHTDNRKVELNDYNPDNPNDNLGGRPALGSIFLIFTPLSGVFS